ncbi:hypothetical protein LTR53_017102 [Teratosphaeriaceae sp. CCFEE 6253]|nr:hypothetical protein LTR53_017102 [Teratosphaeriaceae sp. CCFEE 6253]
MPPSQQFAGWAGYAAASAAVGMPDAVDDEDARRHARLLEVAPWIDTPPAPPTGREGPAPDVVALRPGATAGNPVTIQDHQPAFKRQSSGSEPQGGVSDSGSSGRSSKRSRRRSIFDSLIPSRLSRRRKKLQKVVRAPTSAPREVAARGSGSQQKLVGTSPGTIGYREAVRGHSGSRALEARGSLGSLGILPDRGPGENDARGSLQRGAALSGFSIPPHSSLPPLEGWGPVRPVPPFPPPTSTTTPAPVQERRSSSMQDFAFDMFRDLVVPGGTWHRAPPAPVREGPPRTPRGTRLQLRGEGRGKGKGKGKEPVYLLEGGGGGGGTVVEPGSGRASFGALAPPSMTYTGPYGTALGGAQPPAPVTYAAPYDATLGVDQLPPSITYTAPFDTAPSGGPQPPAIAYTAPLDTPPPLGQMYPNLSLPHDPHFLSPASPAPLEYPGFMALRDGTGYMCLVCAATVRQPLLHSSDGAFCFHAEWDPIPP